MISFVYTRKPCVFTPHIQWHLRHGEVRDAVNSAGVAFGVVYYTLLPGTGLVVHFDVRKDISIPLSDLIGAFRRQFELLKECPLVLTTVDSSSRSLLKLLRRLGCVELARYRDPDGDYILLQYSQKENANLLTTPPQQKGTKKNGKRCKDEQLHSSAGS